jgi:hypothetical protein
MSVIKVKWLHKKTVPIARDSCEDCIKGYYKELLFASLNFAWAAANLAIGTLGPEQETYVSPSSWQNRIESG